MRKFFAIIFVFLLAVGFSFAAGQTEKSVGGKLITVTDLLGRQVKVRVPVERIVLQSSGSGGAFYTLFALGGKDVVKRIVGIDPGLKMYRHWIWEKFSKAVPELKNIPDIGYVYKGNFNVEKVITLKPDVIIVPPFAYQRGKDVFKKLNDAGIPVVVIDYHSETLKTHLATIKLLGLLLGKEKRAKELGDFYKEQVEKVYSRLKQIKKPKPKVYIECGMKGPSEYSNTYGNYMWGALIEKCGGINIARGKIEKWGPINPEYLLSKNPDVIIITGSYWPKTSHSMRLGYYANVTESRKLLAAFTKREGWNTLKAVKEGRVYSIHHGLSRDIWDFVPIQFMAKCFYPDIFKDLDPVASFKEFHKRFLPVKYSGVWMLSLIPDKE